MKVLAIDTSTNACSVALQQDGEIMDRHVVRPREHTRLLIPLIEELLAAGGSSEQDLDALILGNGPGSFIGMRIAASVAQGLAYGTRAALVPVSSLAAIAAEAFAAGEAERVVVAQDAHMSEVYLAAYEKLPDGLPRQLGGMRLQAISSFELPGQAAPAWYAAGAGWDRYPELRRLNEEWLAGLLPYPLPSARFLLAPGIAAWRAGGAVDPALLEPAYVRSQVAKPAADAG